MTDYVDGIAELPISGMFGKFKDDITYINILNMIGWENRKCEIFYS